MTRIARHLALIALAMCAAVLPAAAAEPPSMAQVKALLEKGQHQDARVMGEALLQDREARGAGESEEAAELLHLLLWAARQRNDSGDDGRRVAERAIAVKEKVFGPGHPSLADTLWSAGLLRMRAGDYEAAQELYDRSLAIREKALGPDDLAVADVLLEMGNLLQRQGRFAEAVPVYERALDIREKRLGPRAPDVASVLHNMGNLRNRMGDYVQSRDHYQRSLEIRRGVLGPRHIDVALTLVTMGVLYQKMGDYDRAREVLEEAIPICLEAQGPDSLLLSGAYNNLGNVHWSVGEARKARDAYRQALDIKTRVLGPEHFGLCEELNNLAVSLKALGEYDAAIPQLQRSIRLIETRLGADSFLLSDPLNNLANIMVLKGRLAEARPLYERSFSIRITRLGRRHPEVAESLMNQAGLALAEGNRPQALAQAVESADLLLTQIRDTLAYLPESSALALASAKDQPQAVLFQGLRTARADASAWLEACWNWALRRKGIVLEEMAARQRTMLGDAGPPARAAWESLSRARADLGTLWVDGPGNAEPAAYQQKLKEAVARKESAEERLAGLSARYKFEQERRRADLAALRRSLRPGEAVVEIARVEVGMPAMDGKPVHDIALIVGPDGGVTWENLGTADTIDRLVASWRAALYAAVAPVVDAGGPAPGTNQLASAGRDLRQAVWDPLARHLAGARLVYLVPDGALHQVDFGALPADGKRYLMETAPPLQVISTSRDLLARSAGPTGSSADRSRGLLALGSPDFALSATVASAQSADASRLSGVAEHCIPLREMEWAPLPESAREVETIASLFRERGPITLLTGPRATAEALLRESRGRRILHIATHGFFRGSCGDSSRNPLLHAGLVLAGTDRMAAATDKRARQSGILTAEEIVAADLRGVELAVLSACDTGRGEVAVGEGVFGLRRALEIAGARTVVMSLWPVPDRQARRWMTSFYRAYLDGVLARDAARRASLDALGDLRKREMPTHPYRWAGFVVAGGAD